MPVWSSALFCSDKSLRNEFILHEWLRVVWRERRAVEILPKSPLTLLANKNHSSIYNANHWPGNVDMVAFCKQRAHWERGLPVVMLHMPQFASHLCHLFRNAAVSYINLLFIFAIDPYLTAIHFLVCYDVLQLLFKCCSLQRAGPDPAAITRSHMWLLLPRFMKT